MTRASMVLLLSLLVSACDQAFVVPTQIEDYEQARDVFWKQLYNEQGETLYCAERFTNKNRRGINIEHVFPMSWVTNALDCGTRQQCRQRSTVFNRIEADLHNLYPARTDINSARSSHRFGTINGERRDFGACDFEVNRRGRVAEPAPEARGIVARAMFYMAAKYKDQGLVIFSRSARQLQEWHNQHPPTEEEKRRNHRIAALQGNSNLFIEKPEALNELMADGYFD